MGGAHTNLHTYLPRCGAIHPTGLARCIGPNHHHQDHETLRGLTWSYGWAPGPGRPPAVQQACRYGVTHAGMNLVCSRVVGHSGMCMMDLRCQNIGPYGGYAVGAPVNVIGHSCQCVREDGHAGYCEFFPYVSLPAGAVAFQTSWRALPPAAAHRVFPAPTSPVPAAQVATVRQSCGRTLSWPNTPTNLTLACARRAGHVGPCVLDLKCVLVGPLGTIGQAYMGSTGAHAECCRPEGHSGGDHEFLPTTPADPSAATTARAHAVIAQLQAYAAGSGVAVAARAAVGVAAAASTPPPKPESIADWYDRHAGHGRRGPYFDATLGEYHRHQCPCGDRFTFSNAERDKDPARFALPGRHLP